MANRVDPPKVSIGIRLLLAWSLSICFLGSPMASARTIYSYIDEQGNLIATDAPDTIPPRYRARVRTLEEPDPVAKTPSAMQSVQHAVESVAKNIGIKWPAFHIAMDGLNPAQSRILTYAGGIAVLLVLTMLLSKSHPIRLLSFCLLIVLAIGTPVLMYVSDGGPVEVMKGKAAAAGQAQQDRLQQVAR